MKDFMKKKRLSQEDYFQALSLTQLVSIDLLIFFQNRLLVGKRSNNPARGSLFVPGGKVYKNEYLSEGLERISKQEIGFPLHTSQLRLKGLYDHIYENNFQDDSCGTHYVTIACQFELPLSQKEKISIIEDSMLEQHHHIEWLQTEDVLDHPKIHDNVKSYFQDSPTNIFL